MDNSSYSVEDRKVLFCRSIVYISKLCILLEVWFLINFGKKQLLNSIIYMQNIAYRVPHFSRWVLFYRIRVDEWIKNTVHTQKKTGLVSHSPLFFCFKTISVISIWIWLRCKNRVQCKRLFNLAYIQDVIFSSAELLHV